MEPFHTSTTYARIIEGGAAFRVTVVGDRLPFAQPVRLDQRGGISVRHDGGPHGVGTTRGETDVVVVRSLRVGVALDRQAALGSLDQVSSKFVDHLRHRDALDAHPWATPKTALRSPNRLAPLGRSDEGIALFRIRRGHGRRVGRTSTPS
jgi:hypothetical protein